MRCSKDNFSPPKPGIPVRILNRIYGLLPIKSKIRMYAVLLLKRLGAENSPDPVQGITFSLAGREELEAIMAHPEALSNRVYSSRICNGDRCYCLKQDGEVVCYNWVRHTSCCSFCGRRVSFNFVPLDPGQVFVYDLYTYEAQRGKGLANHMKNNLCYELQSQGIKEIYSIVEPANIASLKIHIRLGSEVRSLVYGYGLFRWTRTFTASRQDEESMRQWIRGLSDSINAGQSSRGNEYHD